MKKADYNDLMLERWLRKRNAGEIRWITKDGKAIPVNEMSDSHLENAISLLLRHDEGLAAVEDIPLADD